MQNPEVDIVPNTRINKAECFAINFAAMISIRETLKEADKAKGPLKKQIEDTIATALMLSPIWGEA